jgi:hypothetical protein
MKQTRDLVLQAAETNGKLEGARAMVNALLDLLDKEPARTRAAFARAMERKLDELEVENLHAIEAIVNDAHAHLRRGAI